MTKVLQLFSVQNAKQVDSTLWTNCNLSGRQNRKTMTEKVEMMRVPYASIVGSLMYMMVCTMPDIEYVVGLVSRYMSNLGKEHWVAVKWILQYLKGTLSVCL